MFFDRNAIEKYLEGTRISLIENYVRMGLRASGRYADELETFIDESAGLGKMGIRGAYHSFFMESGRGPNREKSPESAKKLYPLILRWIEDKGINPVNKKQFAFRTALKIVYEGIKVPNQYNPGGVVSEIINQRWFDQLIEVIGGNIIAEFRTEFIKGIKIS